MLHIESIITHFIYNYILFYTHARYKAVTKSKATEKFSVAFCFFLNNQRNFFEFIVKFLLFLHFLYKLDIVFAANRTSTAVGVTAHVGMKLSPTTQVRIK